MNLQEISLDKINFGSNMNVVDKQLRESIKSIGLLQPPVLRPVEDGYEILNGWSRLRACRELGWSTVKCLVYDGGLPPIVESVKYVPTKPFDYARQLRRILDANPDLSIEDLAEKLDRTARWVNQRLSLNNLIPICAELLDNERICLGNAYILASLSAELQARFVNEAQTMFTEGFRRFVEMTNPAIGEQHGS